MPFFISPSGCPTRRSASSSATCQRSLRDQNTVDETPAGRARGWIKDGPSTTCGSAAPGGSTRRGCFATATGARTRRAFDTGAGGGTTTVRLGFGVTFRIGESAGVVRTRSFGTDDFCGRERGSAVTLRAGAGGLGMVRSGGSGRGGGDGGGGGSGRAGTTCPAGPFPCRSAAKRLVNSSRSILAARRCSRSLTRSVAGGGCPFLSGISGIVDGRRCLSDAS